MCLDGGSSFIFFEYRLKCLLGHRVFLFCFVLLLFVLFFCFFVIEPGVCWTNLESCSPRQRIRQRGKFPNAGELHTSQYSWQREWYPDVLSGGACKKAPRHPLIMTLHLHIFQKAPGLHLSRVVGLCIPFLCNSPVEESGYTGLCWYSAAFRVQGCWLPRDCGPFWGGSNQ